MDGKAWNTRRCWSSTKDCLVRNGKDSQEGARDVGDMCPVSRWSIVMTRLTGEETAIITARAYAETRIIIIPYFTRVIQSAKMKLLSTEALLKNINRSK